MSGVGPSPCRKSTVGLIVNPHAGKDVRRLTSPAGQTSDAVKVDIMRRVVAAAFEHGAQRVLLSRDSHQLGSRAVDGIRGDVEFVDSPATGSYLDTVAAAAEMWKADAGAVVALGGDGTCRDVATGWPTIPLIALSTGTNNVFPEHVDATSAGTAAALVATGLLDIDEVATMAERVAIAIAEPHAPTVKHDSALVEAALVDTAFVGARAVTDPSSLRWVVASLANPASTGISSLAGRLHPIPRESSGGLVVRLGSGGTQVRVPLSPGTFSTLSVVSAEPIARGEHLELPGGGVLAYDGERTTPVSADATITASIDATGPMVIDVQRALNEAARRGCFRAGSSASCGKDNYGD